MKRGLFVLILLGIVIRLIFAFFITHTFDFINILAIAKSVADTGAVTDGFFVIKRHGLEVQLYGKIYYQFAALWLLFLEKIRILDIRYIFDTKPFTNSLSYMTGIFQWNPPHYQLLAIRLGQFFFDFVLLIFLYKIAQLLNIKKAKTIVLFWAINFYLIFTAYAMFQSDLSMIAFLAGGVYFAMRALLKNSNKLIDTDKLISLVLLAAGAVIKQMPIVIVPFILVAYSRSWRTFIFYALSFASSYFLINQPWASDAPVLKFFYLNSTESLALFNFQLNGISVFLIGYLLFFIAVIANRKKVFEKPVNILYLTAIIVSLIYITEDSSLFFPQFNVWIMPFILLIALAKNEYAFFLAAPIIGFMKRTMIDSDFLTGALRNTMGLDPAISWRNLLKPIVNPTLVDYGLNTVMVLLYIYFIMLLLSELKIITFIKPLPQNCIDFCRRHFSKIIVLFLVSYTVFLFIDIPIKLHYYSLKTDIYDIVPGELVLEGDDRLSIGIVNPQKYTITGMKTRSWRGGINGLDKLVFRFTDNRTGKILDEEKFYDIQISKDEDDNYFLFKKQIAAENMTLQIFKEEGVNTVRFAKAKYRINDLDNPQNDRIHVKFANDQGIRLDILGNYPLSQLSVKLTSNMSEKPKFYAVYFGLIVLSLGAIVVILLRRK